jgi:predicted NUDIX family phosphoesterase
MNASMQEQILVIPNSKLFENHTQWYGINHENIESILATIVQYQESMQRSLAENNQAYKQIISYLIFTFDGQLFVMQRKNKPNEQALANKLSIGIGGHMTQTDIQGQTLFDWVSREFEEEVTYEGNLQMHTIGFLNDDTNEVGQRHLGLVILLKGDNPNIAIHGNEHKSGQLMSMEECFEKLDQFEAWSQIILQRLIS